MLVISDFHRPALATLLCFRVLFDLASSKAFEARSYPILQQQAQLTRKIWMAWIELFLGHPGLMASEAR
jgi:hypothetical protein